MWYLIADGLLRGQKKEYSDFLVESLKELEQVGISHETTNLVRSSCLPQSIQLDVTHTLSCFI